MNKRKIVAIDLDDVVWDFVSGLLRSYNLRYNDNVTLQDITEWDIHKFLKPECDNIFKEFSSEEYISSLVINEDIVDILSVLNTMADIYFVTASYSQTISQKGMVLKKYLPFYNDNMLVKLSDKKLFKADYFLDDCPNNLEGMDCKTFLIKKPWNCYEKCIRYTTKKALLNIILEITLEDIESRDNFTYKEEGVI